MKVKDQDRTVEDLRAQLEDREKTIQNVQHQLKERVKELRCIYSIAELVETPGLTSKDLLEKSASIVAASWQYPETACCRIRVNGANYQTGNFKQTRWRQKSPIRILGRESGRIEVCYLEKRPEKDEGPFLREERELLDAVSERLGRVLERLHLHAERIESEKMYRQLFELGLIGMAVTDPNTKQWIEINDRLCDMIGYSREDLKQMDWAAMTHPDDLQADLAQFDRVLAGDIDGYKLDKRFIRKDGGAIHTAVSIHCQRTQGGACSGYLPSCMTSPTG